MKTKIFLFCLLFTTLLIPKIHAQWAQIGYMVTNGNDTAGLDHGFDAFGNDVFCSTADGLFQSSDNGDSWQNITAGKPNTDGEDFYTVFRAVNNDLFAGSSNRLFKSTDAGASWTWLNTLPDSANWLDVTEIGGNTLASFVKGSSYGVYYSANGGSSWTLATGLSSNVRFFTVDGNTVYLGGGANGVYNSTDNGQTWSLTGTGFAPMAGIWSVLKEGGSYFANSISGQGLYVSRDNGLTWGNTDTTVFHDFCQVFSITEAGGKILASMDGACNNSASIKMSSDNGMSWTVFMDSLPQAYYPNIGRNAAGTSFFTKRGGPSGKKVYRYDLGAAGIADLQAEVSFTVYPNPASTSVTLALGEQVFGEYRITVYDLLGKEMADVPLLGRSTQCDVSAWPAGIYAYCLWENGERVKSGKMVVE